MLKPRTIRNLLGIFKDKISIIKATIHLTKHPTPLLILRATSHNPSTTSQEDAYIIQDILTVGNDSRSTATVCIQSLIHRLHRTRDSIVALKCLITIHNIIQRGSEVYKDVMLHYSGNYNDGCGGGGGYDFLNLSRFVDDDERELSYWVRWYAGVIERNLIVTRVLGFYLLEEKNGKKVSKEFVFLLLKELDSLVSMVEEISGAPESLEYQRMSSIYEVMKLVCEDYRMTMRGVYRRLIELDVKIEDLRIEELEGLGCSLKRLGDCKEKLVLMFLNKKMNDGVWEMIFGLRKKIEVSKERRENMMRLVRVVDEDQNKGGRIKRSEFVMKQLGDDDDEQRVIERRSESWELLLLETPSTLCIDPWFDVVERNSLTVSMG